MNPDCNFGVENEIKNFKDMITAFMTWCGVVAVVGVAATGRVATAVAKRGRSGKRCVIGRSSESEMLYVPGDIVAADDENVNDD